MPGVMSAAYHAHNFAASNCCSPTARILAVVLGHPHESEISLVSGNKHWVRHHRAQPSQQCSITARLFYKYTVGAPLLDSQNSSTVMM
jgi:hypothetical protein